MNSERDQATILEMYKVYVEMADRISARRGQANAFFLALHTSAMGALCIALYTIEQIHPRILVLMPFMVGITLCLVWWWLLNSYRQINRAKYEVIGHLENTLPMRPYSELEWERLGKGKDCCSYLPLSMLEKAIPIIFGGAYMCLAIYFTLKH